MRWSIGFPRNASPARFPRRRSVGGGSKRGKPTSGRFWAARDEPTQVDRQGVGLLGDVGGDAPCIVADQQPSRLRF
jgi:hypothetical protein